ncbi:hypothetical protein [Pseudomonas sp. FW300-N1A1]|uniref:hypothetical protein n=1 Tax=Pseudomonas sp. FW300-N1A1 TaxID=2075555 RepID=UPI0011AECC3D|nr:hypothetical protein [Pseudomonas sp. FW300-N1A1]
MIEHRQRLQDCLFDHGIEWCNAGRAAKEWLPPRPGTDSGIARKERHEGVSGTLFNQQGLACRQLSDFCTDGFYPYSSHWS